MTLKKLLLIVFLLLCTSSTCINRSIINDMITPSAFIILDSYIGVQIEIGSNKCFDEVASQDLELDESYQKWGECMEDYKTMEGLIDKVRDNIEDGSVESFKDNFKLLVDLMQSLGLDIPDDIQTIING